MGGRGGRGHLFISDSSGFGTSRFVEWQHAKYGKFSVHGFAKTTSHTPIWRGMLRHAHARKGQLLAVPEIDVIPDGSGDARGDAAFGGVKNCNVIRDSGQRVAIDAKLYSTPKGLNARAEMRRFREEHPRTFHNILRIRNNVKERLLNEGEVRRDGQGPQAAHRSVELLSIGYTM